MFSLGSPRVAYTSAYLIGGIIKIKLSYIDLSPVPHQLGLLSNISSSSTAVIMKIGISRLKVAFTIL